MKIAPAPLTGLGLLACLLAACTLQTNTVVQPTGAGELRTEVGLTAADQQVLRTIASSPEQFCRDLQASQLLPAGATVSVEQRGLDVWCVLGLPFADLNELQSLYSEMEGVSVNSLLISDGVFTYDVEVEVLGSLLAEFGPMSPTIRWQVTMPGRVLSHNADQSAGRTVSWSLATDEPLRAQATSELAGGDGLWAIGQPNALLAGALILFICCLTGIGAALGVAAIVLVRRRRPTVVL
jgi:hypothetical protein